jgi:hypothetical protein
MKEINISDKKQNNHPNEPTVTPPNEQNVQSANERTVVNNPPEPKNVDTQTGKFKKVKKKKGNGKSIDKKKGILIISAIALVTILGLAFFYYFGIYRYNPKPKDEDIITINESHILTKNEPQTFARLLLDNPEQPRTEESPVNGLLFTKTEMDELMQRRPVAAMVSNHAKARPQSSLNSADIVYETLVESGITRYMAIFWSQGPQKVGSIRSARQYYLEWLSPYDPIYIHDGCASTDDPRTNACGNIYSYNIKDISTAGSWRWNDGVRYAPHNEYSSVLTAWEYAEDRGWEGFPSDFESWKFKNDLDQIYREEGKKYEITFHNRLYNAGGYNAIWEYDLTTNSYKRWIGGNPDIDQETNTQVYAKVVVVQETDLTPSYDSKGRVIIDTIGQGEATILMDGREINGSWEKDNRMDRTTFYDDDGDEIEFNRGRIWVTAIAQSVSEFDIIEQ